MSCNCPGNVCTCVGTPRHKDQIPDRATFHLPLMLKDSAMGTTLTISEKREAVAKAYGEAAVKKLAEAGAKSADYKAAYAQRSGELFVGGKDDKFIEGFHESLQAGKSPDETEQLLGSSTGKHPTDSATITADTMPSPEMTLDQAMSLPRYAGMWPSQRQIYAARDLALAKAGSRGSLDYQQGVRDAHAERLSNAWKGGDKDNLPTTDAAKAYGQLRHDLSEAWKR